jgi:hypothetical protein
MAIHAQKLQHLIDQAKTLEPIRVAVADAAQGGVIDPGAMRVGMSTLESRTSARRREAEPVTVVGAGPAGLACTIAGKRSPNSARPMRNMHAMCRLLYLALLAGPERVRAMNLGGFRASARRLWEILITRGPAHE